MTYNFKNTIKPLCKNCWASNALTRRRRAKLKMDIFASAAQSTRSRSQTTLTRFWFFYHLPPCVEIFYGINVDQKKWTILDHLPTSSIVNVVCERPLLPASSTLSTSINRFHLQKWKLGHQGKFEFAFFPFFQHITYYILRVSVQGVRSPGGHFAGGLIFIKKIFLFFKKKGEIILHF